MRRLKNRYGVSPTPALRPELWRPANAKVPCPSRKKSRFSGKNRLKRVRFTCCSSTSTCAKSVRTVKSAVRFGVMPYFASPPRCAGEVVDDRRRAVLSVGHARNGVRLQLDVAALPAAPAGRQRAGGRHLEDAAEGGERARNLREVRPLVLPAHDAPQVDAPGLVASRADSAAT